MRALKFSGITACALVALSLAFVPAFSQVAAPGSDPNAATPPSDANQTGVPQPEFIELAPLKADDVAPSGGSAAGAPAAGERSSQTAATPAAGSEPPTGSTSSVQSTSSAKSVPPTGPTPGNAVAAASPMLSPAEIERAVPLPDPANVAPPSVKDIGPPPPHPADLALAEKLRSLIPGGIDRTLDRKRDRAAVEDFYRARGFSPLWFDLGEPNARMSAAIARLKAADADGLEASDYPTPDPKTIAAGPEVRARAELALTASVLNYARQAQGGRVSPSRISTNIEFAPNAPDPAEVLEKIASAKDVAKALDEFNPTHDGYLALKRKLAEMRGVSADDHVVQIPAGGKLRPGGSDKRIPLLRQRLGVSGDAADLTYDHTLVEAVKVFQREKGINADGALTPRTLEALNGRSHSRDIATIVSNMERWRWLPRDLGRAYVMVNVPDFTLSVVNNHKTVFHTRIVVGKPGTPSPSFSAAIENILVNPTWHVPQSIIYNEYLPALKDDPSVLTRMGLVMEHNRDGTISIRQPPGERNALGRIKFNFPNRFQVYLHDTPDKKLFAHDRRAYSHGCMRVQNPTQFGEALASIALPEQGITSERLQRMFGTGEQWLNFKRKIPVHLVYLNAYVDTDGKLVVREDLYGYDARVQSALRGEYMAMNERSQRVSPTAPRRTRQVVQEVPQPQRGGFFRWFQ